MDGSPGDGTVVAFGSAAGSARATPSVKAHADVNVALVAYGGTGGNGHDGELTIDTGGRGGVANASAQGVSTGHGRNVTVSAMQIAGNGGLGLASIRQGSGASSYMFNAVSGMSDGWSPDAQASVRFGNECCRTLVPDFRRYGRHADF